MRPVNLILLLVLFLSSPSWGGTVALADNSLDLLEESDQEDLQTLFEDENSISPNLIEDGDSDAKEDQIKEKGSRDDSADVEVILGAGPMISPDIIIEKFSDSKINVHDTILEAAQQLDAALTSTTIKSPVIRSEVDSKVESESDERLDSDSIQNDEADNEIFDSETPYEGHMSKFQHKSDDDYVKIKKPKNGATCHHTLNGTSGSFEMNFDDDCTILIGTPQAKSRIILHCESMKLPTCNVSREAITVNLKGDLKFGRNSFFYCGDSQIRATAIRRRIALRIKRTANVKGSTKCHFFSRKQRFLPYFQQADVKQSGFGSLCGRLGRTSKIVGGKKVPPGLFPWIAQLDITRADGSQTACTGSLISDRFVLTAAHCLKNAEYISVYMGGADRLEFTGSEVTIQAEKYVLHRRWNPKTLTADLALVKLSVPVKFTEEVSPICIQEPESLLGLGIIRRETWQGKTGVAAGWGRLSTKETAPRRLYRVKLPFLDDRKCQRSYSTYFQKRSMLCTESTTEAAICYGDSGGPLMYKKKEVVYQVGLSSFSLSRKCGESPDVFTKISEYSSWIKTRVKIDS